MINEKAIYSVKNRSASTVIYSIPEMNNLRREFRPGEIKSVTGSELIQLSYRPGGRRIIENYLLSNNEEVLDGLNMEVDDKSIPCTECAGYEKGEEVNEDVSEKAEETKIEDTMNPPFDETTDNMSNSPDNASKCAKVNKCTPKSKKDENDVNNKVTAGNEKVSKVKEEKKAVENTVKEDGIIKVISMRYTSGATIKKGDNYFKFVAEEEWDVSRIEDVQEAREKLWAKLNAEVDSQIEELNNMN